MPITNVDELVPATGWLRSASVKERMGLGTVPTTGVPIVSTLIVKFAGVLSSVQVVAHDALTANDTNFITFAIQNKGAGAANVAMLLATDVNTTKATLGAALVAFTKRTLSLNATSANLVVAVGDTIEVSAAPSGTLGNAVTGMSFLLIFTPT